MGAADHKLERQESGVRGPSSRQGLGSRSREVRDDDAKVREVDGAWARDDAEDRELDGTTLKIDGAKAVISSVMRSPMPLNILVPLVATTFACKFLRHPFSNAAKHSGAARRNHVRMQVPADIENALRDGLEGGSVEHANLCGYRERTS